ncbi:Mannan endo-1,6-alpha-mannosidase DCW1 [Verticillium dahliae VDG1]|nr:Mannan endo-1,6-alpha-mannosidase DCW1 [Verticillium dahliae VDG1]
MSLQPPPTNITPTPSPRRPQAGALSAHVRSPTVDIASFWVDQPDHDQQSPTARHQLARLLCRRARGGENANRSGIMAGALLGLAPPSRLDDTHTNKIQIQQPDQIQDHLRRTIEYSVRPTRAEHVSVTFDIRNTVQFTLVSADNNTPAPPANANVDPALDGAPPPVPAIAPTAARTVRVNDALANQPQDDPSLQRSVASHIVELLGAVDGATWAVRDISCGPQGWTVTYACKHSLAVWLRQHQKNPDKGLIGDYSQKDPEMAIFARPAFDCRGSLTVAFSKSARAISVKYEHTPFHKTVKEMAEYFRPPPPPMPTTAATAETTETTKKTPRRSKAAAGNGHDNEGEGGAAGQTKKTPRKRKSDADGATSTKRKRKSKSDAGQNAATNAVMVPAALDGADGDTQAQTRADEVVQSSVHSHALLNVPPAEATRRRETAIRLLSEGGKESLIMLAKYGAERLRIVHPKDQAASETPSGGESSTEQTPQPANGEAAVEPGASSVEPTVAVGNAEGGKKAAKPKLTRGACTPCRSSRIKCDRKKPSCDACIAADISCEYPLQQTRVPKGESSGKPAKPRKSPVRVEPDTEPEEVEDPEPDDIETIDYTSNMPVASMVTPAADLSTQDYFNTGSGGLSFPQTNHPDVPVINPSSMTYPAPPPAAEETYSEVQAAVVSPPKPRQTNGRRSLPSGPTQAAPDAEQTQAQVNYASSWQQGASDDTALSASTRSPTLAKQAARQFQQHQQHQQPSPTVQPAQTVTPSQTSPFQVPAQTARAKSRTGQRSQTPHGAQRTSTPSHHTVQQTRSPAAPPPTSAYSDRTSSTSHLPPAQASQQAATSDYTATAAAADQTWPDTQGRTSQTYSTGTSSAATSAQHQHHQSTSLQQFDMRSKGPGHQQTRSQQQPYGSYTPQQQQQAPTSSRQQQGHEQTQSAAQQQSSWYGSFGSGSSSFVSANATPGYGTRSSGSAGYGSGTTSTASYGQQQHPQQQQQHRQQQHHGLSSMAAHGYGGAEGDIFDLLKAGMNSR